MFGTYSFGTTPFGESAKLLAEDNLGLPYSSADFLPSALADLDLYKGLTEVLDYMLYNYHHSEIQKMAGLYDVFHPSFDEDFITIFLGGNDFIVQALTAEQKTTLCLLLSSLYEIKGLRKGIEGILSMMGIPATLYESWEVAEEVETGRASRPLALKTIEYSVNTVNRISSTENTITTNKRIRVGTELRFKHRSGNMPIGIEQNRSYWVIECVKESGIFKIKITENMGASTPVIILPAPSYGSMDILEKPRGIFSSAIWREKIPQCTVAIVYDATGRVVYGNVDVNVQKAIEGLLWVCAQVKSFMWVMNYRGAGLEDWHNETLEDPVSTDASNFMTYQSFCDKYKFAADEDWCLLFKPIIECEETPNEDKVLAVFTERPPITDITHARVYQTPDWDGFLLVDWSNGDYPKWELTHWDYVDGKASISYALTDYTDPTVTPPLFYSLSKNNSYSGQVPVTGTFIVSFTLKADRTIPLLVTMIPDSSYPDYIAHAEAADVQILSDSLNNVAMTGASGRSFAQVILSTNGEKKIVLWPISAENELLVLSIQGMLMNQTEVNLEITDFKVERFDFPSVDLTSYSRYSAFKEYYVQRPARSSFRSYATDSITPASSTIKVPFTLESNQLLYFTGNLPLPFLGNSYYYVLNPVVDYDGSTTFQVSLTPSGDPLDLSDMDVSGYTYYYELRCETYNKLQRGKAQEQKYGWVFSDDGSPEASARDSYTLINNAGNLEVFVDRPIWEQSLVYTFNQVDRVQDVLNFSLPTPFVGVISLSCDTSLSQGEVEISFGTQEYSFEAESFQFSKVVEVLTTIGSKTLSFKTPGYIPLIDQSFMFQVKSNLRTGYNKVGLSEFTIDFNTNKVSIPKSSFTLLSSSCSLVYIHEMGSPSLIGTGFYYIVDYSENLGVATFSLSLTYGGSVIDLGSLPLDDTLTFMAIPAVCSITNIQIEVDETTFTKGLTTGELDERFTFEEIGNPGDPVYWKVNDDSDFWMVASEQQPYCCPDTNIPGQSIELGYDGQESDLYEDTTKVLDGWNLEDEIATDELQQIIGHIDGNPATSLIPVEFNWVVGTQVRIRAVGDGDMPKEYDGTPLEESAIYYIIPYDDDGADPKIYRVKIASSYSNAIAGTWILLQGSVSPDTFEIAGSQLPPSWRENLP